MVSDRELVQRLGPVGRAFFGRFNALREVQRHAIEPIFSGENVLLSSATASGKTEAVFAPLIARIRAQASSPREEVLVLAVAPTRALVNDLHARLQGPLGAIGWSCGRQTSDHHDKAGRPHVLITTPESFDSMLVRDSKWEHGALVGHLLASVEALFIDEAHLFEFSPRGDQLVWLFGRLRRLRGHALRQGWTSSEEVQVCAASATVSNPDELARRLLGESSRAVLVTGSREIEILSTDAATDWVPLEEIPDPEAIYANLVFVNGPDDMDSIVRRVWQAIERGSVTDCRKVLVFVPSRALCDRLSLALADALKTRRELFVGAHHGSLEPAMREYAELEFSRSRDAILVATTTLEVGIDIGDVDVVVVVGAPPDTSSLLQRIGRSGRRGGPVRVVPIVRGPMEGRALCSMLDAACRGSLDPSPQARLWSVFVQQAASHTAQARKRGRRRTELIALAQAVWPEAGGPTTASQILDALVEQGVLTESGGRMFLGGEWSDRFERAGGDVHHNFEAGAKGISVVDASTGAIITHVSQPPVRGGSVALAGRRWNVVSQSGEIVIASAAAAKGDATFQYTTRTAPTGKSYAEHARRGFGFGATEAPLVSGSRDTLWFHFGGSVYEVVLRALLPGMKSVRGLLGLALSGVVTQEALRALSNDPTRLPGMLRELADDIAAPLSLGRYHDLLPEELRKTIAVNLLDPQGFAGWLASREITTSEQRPPAEDRLRAALGWAENA